MKYLLNGPGLPWASRTFLPTHIEVFEWKRSDVIKNRLANSPQWTNLATPKPSLSFSVWKLAHAVVKADFLIPKNLILPSLGFILQLEHILAFGSPSGLRLANGAATLLADVTHTSLSGRLGQGLSILFAESRDYRFAGHLQALSSPPKGEKAADFVFEDFSGDRMILESKTSFSQQDNDPSKIKSVLKGALLKQVDPSMANLAPPPTKGYAVYSCLREMGCATPSALIFVDPPEQKPRTPIELPTFWVRQQNYAGWLEVMGFRDAARRLRSGQTGDGHSVTVAIQKMEGREFALLPFMRTGPLSGSLWAGIDLEILKAIAAEIAVTKEGAVDYPDFPFTSSFEASAQTGSLMKDGTYFGTLDRTNLEFRVLNI